MISQIDDEQAVWLLPFFARRATDSVRIASLLDAYGTGHAFFSIYLQDHHRAVLAQIDDTFLLMDRGADYADLARFFQLSPNFARLMGAYAPLEKIAARLPGGVLDRYVRMAAYAVIPANVPEVRIERSPDLRDVYAVEGATCAPFNAWYVDISHRIRHGCARAYLVRVDDEPAAACLISAESRWAGLISSVATGKAWRGRGFATALVQAACADLLGCGKLPVLECAFSLCTFYTRLGFLRDCEIGTYMPADTGRRRLVKALEAEDTL